MLMVDSDWERQSDEHNVTARAVIADFIYGGSKEKVCKLSHSRKVMKA